LGDFFTTSSGHPVVMQVVQSNFQVDRKVGGARAKVDFFETPTRKKKFSRANMCGLARIRHRNRRSPVRIPPGQTVLLLYSAAICSPSCIVDVRVFEGNMYLMEKYEFFKTCYHDVGMMYTPRYVCCSIQFPNFDLERGLTHLTTSLDGLGQPALSMWVYIEVGFYLNSPQGVNISRVQFLNVRLFTQRCTL
jgi:hypothetical protein